MAKMFERSNLFIEMKGIKVTTDNLYVEKPKSSFFMLGRQLYKLPPYTWYSGMLMLGLSGEAAAFQCNPSSTKFVLAAEVRSYCCVPMKVTSIPENFAGS